MAHCKYIGLQSGWNRRKSGFGWVQVTYLKVKFWFELGRTKYSLSRAGLGKILKFRPV
jgi:hypothetical protein